MRYAWLALALVACATRSVDPKPLEIVNRQESSRPAPGIYPSPRKVSEPKTPEPSKQEETKPFDCEATRAQRVQWTKDGIEELRRKLERLKPLLKFAKDHKCELKDTSGTVLVRRKQEANGTRISVKPGRADDLICDTTKLPPDFDAEVMKEMIAMSWLEDDEVLFQTVDACDAKERPSLRITVKEFRDKKVPDAILALP